MPTGPDGLASATAAAVAAAGGAGPSQSEQPLQGSLFGREPADPHGVGPVAEDGEDLRRGRGRPPGSKNRSTSQWTDYLLTRYRSPLIGLAELAQAKPDDLALELGCDKLEALRTIMQAQAHLAPYLHQKQPLAVQGGAVGRMLVMIGDLGSTDAAAALRIGPIDNIEEYQRVIDAEYASSESDGRNE